MVFETWNMKTLCSLAFLENSYKGICKILEKIPAIWQGSNNIPTHF